MKQYSITKKIVPERMIYNNKIYFLGKNAEINLNDLPTGIYYLDINYDNVRYSEKLLIK